MNTIRLTVTTDLKREIDFLRTMEYPTLTDAEIAKVSIGALAVRARKSTKKDTKYDDSDPVPEELMRQAEYSFGLDEGDQYEKPFWDESKLKPLNLSDFK